MSNDFYVYTYTADDGKVFYVGKGLNGRANDVANHNPDVVSYAYRNDCHINKVRERLTRDEAFTIEREMIKTYGFVRHGGSLLNRINGQGDGEWAEDWTKQLTMLHYYRMANIDCRVGRYETPDDYLALAGGRCRPGSSVLLPCCGASDIGKYLPNLKSITVNDIDQNNVRLTIGKVLEDMAINGNKNVNGSFITGDFLTAPVDGKFDFIFMNPPFSLKVYNNGINTGSNYYWPFIDRCQSLLAPGGVLVFIAPDSWESGLNATRRRGHYLVLQKSALFPGDAPPASIVLWVNEPGFSINGGRDDSKPVLPRVFNTTVLKTAKGTRRIHNGYGVTQDWIKVTPGYNASGFDILLEGPDSEAFADWLLANKSSIINWRGATASGRPQLRVTAAKELLNV
jgi:hypothetical protein